MCMCLWRPKVNGYVFLLLFILFVEIVTNPELAKWLDWVVSKPWESTCLSSRSKIIDMHCPSWLLGGC